MNFRAIAYAEFYVEDVPKAADFLISAYGFRVDEGHLAARGLALVHGDVRLLLVGASDPRVAEYVMRHASGLAVLAVVCDEPAAAFAEAASRGARVLDHRELVIEVFDDFALRFVEHEDAPDQDADSPGVLFEAIDHLALCVPYGSLARMVEFCEHALGLRPIFSEFIEVGEQAMDSVVVQSESGAVTFTLLEPSAGRRPGQIDGFLAAHDGPGVQHLALRTRDIATAVRTLGSRDVEFLTTPPTYYDALEQRLGPTAIPVDVLRELNVLVDQDHGGQLFQIFSRSTHPRRTFFFELIERRGASTFGTANIKALYEAVERQSVVTEH